jgi:hypothetical protein
MDKYEKKEIKERYIAFLKRIGYKIIYDLDPECEDNLHDLKLLMTMKLDSVYDAKVALRYIPYVVESVSKLSFKEFQRFSGPRQDIREFVVEINNQAMMNYSINDLAAILLKNGANLQDIFQFKDGKGKLVLTPEGIKCIVETLSSQGSPLENFAVRKRILGLK